MATSPRCIVRLALDSWLRHPLPKGASCAPQGHFAWAILRNSTCVIHALRTQNFAIQWNSRCLLGCHWSRQIRLTTPFTVPTRKPALVEDWPPKTVFFSRRLTLTSRKYKRSPWPPCAQISRVILAKDAFSVPRTIALQMAIRWLALHARAGQPVLWLGALPSTQPRIWFCLFQQQLMQSQHHLSRASRAQSCWISWWLSPPCLTFFAPASCTPKHFITSQLRLEDCCKGCKFQLILPKFKVMKPCRSNVCWDTLVYLTPWDIHISLRWFSQQVWWRCWQSRIPSCPWLLVPMFFLPGFTAAFGRYLIAFRIQPRSAGGQFKMPFLPGFGVTFDILAISAAVLLCFALASLDGGIWHMPTARIRMKYHRSMCSTWSSRTRQNAVHGRSSA